MHHGIARGYHSPTGPRPYPHSARSAMAVAR